MSCAEPPAGSFCDVPCATDGDCEPLTSDYRCSGGFCRPGSQVGAGGGGAAAGTAGGTAGGNGGEPGTAGATAGGGGEPGTAGGMAGGGGAGGGRETCPRGEVPADEVVVLGDVFIAQTHEVVVQLEALAREAGALAVDESYRDYSSMTENALAVSGSLLINRYAAARAESPVSVVIMNGGGSDMLLGACQTAPTPDCQLMVDAVVGAEQLLSQMAADGVQQVLWFYYPDPQDAELLAELDVLHPLLQDVCENSTVTCHWLDLQPTFEGHFSEYMQTDFVPTTLGAQAAASTIWAGMEGNCIAQ